MTTIQAPGRRERNKQEKLDRIMRAAGALFAAHGVDDVTTQQIAEAADIGTGTLFLYAKTKGELLLLVQNAHYEQALVDGTIAAQSTTGTLDAPMALLTPIVECNRIHADNGRTYLREMMFGDATEPHHAVALDIVRRTEVTLAEVLSRETGRTDAAVLAHIVSAVMFVAMASAPASVSVPSILGDIRAQLEVVLGS